MCSSCIIHRVYDAELEGSLICVWSLNLFGTPGALTSTREELPLEGSDDNESEYISLPAIIGNHSVCRPTRTRAKVMSQMNSNNLWLGGHRVAQSVPDTLSALRLNLFSVIVSRGDSRGPRGRPAAASSFAGRLRTRAAPFAV